jgi:hydroxyacylglutathione hydrolase
MEGGWTGIRCEIWQMECMHWTFGPFQENTWLVKSDDGRGIVIDPGMSNAAEQAEFEAALRDAGVKLVGCFLTHAHLDHVAGAAYIHRRFGCLPHLAMSDRVTYTQAPLAGKIYGFEMEDLPDAIEEDWNARHAIQWLDQDIEVRFAPGHSAGHVVFVSHDSGWVIAGDVLFHESVGRTDLPGGDGETLRQSIEREMFDLPSDMQIHCGHGPSTTIGHEKMHNPFVNAAGTGLLQSQ